MSQMLLTFLAHPYILARTCPQAYLEARSSITTWICTHTKTNARVGSCPAVSSSPPPSVQYTARPDVPWTLHILWVTLHTGGHTPSGTWTHSHSVKWPESHREGNIHIRGLWWGFLSESLFSHLSLFWPLPMLWTLHWASTHTHTHTHTVHAASWQLNLLETTGHVRTSSGTVMKNYDTATHTAACTRTYAQFVFFGQFQEQLVRPCHWG